MVLCSGACDIASAKKELGPPTRCVSWHRSASWSSTHASRFSSTTNSRIGTLTTRRKTMPTKLAMKTQLVLAGMIARCPSSSSTARRGFVVLRQISRCPQAPKTLAPPRSHKFCAGRWTGRAAFSTSSLKRTDSGEKPPAAAGEGAAGAGQQKAGENGMPCREKEKLVADTRQCILSG